MEQDRATSIQTRAYQLWEENGREHGHHERHWQQAERDVDAAESTATASSSQAGDGLSTPANGEADASAINDGQAKKPRRIPSPIAQP